MKFSGSWVLVVVLALPGLHGQTKTVKFLKRGTRLKIVYHVSEVQRVCSESERVGT